MSCPRIDAEWWMAASRCKQIVLIYNFKKSSTSPPLHYVYCAFCVRTAVQAWAFYVTEGVRALLKSTTTWIYEYLNTPLLKNSFLYHIGDNID